MNGEQPGLVMVRGAADGFVPQIIAGPHHLLSDEPASVGELRLARRPATFYSPRWRVFVRPRHSRVPVEDCAACETQNSRLTVIDREIALDGSLDEYQRANCSRIDHS